MDRNRFSRDTSRESKGGSITLQKKLAVEARRKAENVPDLTDFMNDMFFGTVNVDNNKVYNLTGGGGVMDEDQDLIAALGAIAASRLKNGLKKPGAWWLHLPHALSPLLDLSGQQDLQLLKESSPHCWIEETLSLGLPEGTIKILALSPVTPYMHANMILSISNPFHFVHFTIKILVFESNHV